jgi:hypothetical protein
MLKLYIIEYMDITGDHTSAYTWAQGEADAKDKHAADQSIDGTPSELNKALDNIIVCYEVSNAVQKTDILALVDRYLIKPLKKL